MIEIVNSPGAGRARVTCDTCGRSDTIPCASTGPRGDKAAKADAVKAAVARKLTARRWHVRGEKLLCPICAGKARVEADSRKRKEDAEMAEEKVADAAPVEMTGLQKRMIVHALEDAYDDGAKRYRGAETDKTMAEGLGSGVRAGWVAQVREEMFGPAGGNEEIEAIRAEIDGLRTTCADGIAALSKRLDAVCVAVGPRAK